MAALNFSACPASFLVGLVLLVLVFVQRAESFKLEVYLHVNGSTSLPDPKAVNAFLENNHSLFNPLLSHRPPVQLQLCNATIYSNLIDFYTLEHPGGCESAPGLLRNPDTALRTLEAVWLIWAALMAAFFVLWITSCGYSENFRDCASNALLCFPKVMRIEYGGEIPRCIRFECIAAGFILIAFLTPGVVVFYNAYLGQTDLHAAPLPDPGNLTQFLHSGGQNVTLYRCMIRKAFHVYIGFSGSCGQIDDYLYPEVKQLIGVKKHAFRHTGGMVVLLCVCGVITCLSWLYIVFGFVCHLIGICIWCHERRKAIRHVAQAPSGTGV